jgi:hypothetical protein
VIEGAGLPPFVRRHNNLVFARMRILNFRDAIDRLMVKIRNMSLVSYSCNADPADPRADMDCSTYSWHDNRGWHHVRVLISPFGLPYVKTHLKIIENCVKLHNGSGTITVVISRYDQDNPVGKLWTMKYHTRAADPSAVDLDPAGPPAEGWEPGSSPIAPTDLAELLNRGITSSCTARYGFRPNTVRIISTDAVVTTQQ